MAKKKALPVQHGEGEIETVSLPPAAAAAWRELQGAVRREYEGMHGKVTANTEASSGEQWSRTMDLVDEIKLKLDQAYGICNVVRQARDLQTSQYRIRCMPHQTLSRSPKKRSTNSGKQ